MTKPVVDVEGLDREVNLHLRYSAEKLHEVIASCDPRLGGTLQMRFLRAAALFKERMPEYDERLDRIRHWMRVYIAHKDVCKQEGCSPVIWAYSSMYALVALGNAKSHAEVYREADLHELDAEFNIAYAAVVRSQLPLQNLLLGIIFYKYAKVLCRMKADHEHARGFYMTGAVHLVRYFTAVKMSGDNSGIKCAAHLMARMVEKWGKHFPTHDRSQLPIAEELYQEVLRMGEVPLPA